MALGSHALDVGAMTPMFWFLEEREKVIVKLKHHHHRYCSLCQKAHKAIGVCKYDPAPYGYQPCC